MIELRAGTARARVVPELGGGLADLTADGPPVLRPLLGKPGDDPFELALNLLVPFSNRISGGFTFDGRRHELSPNLEREAFPIHGDGFLKRWEIDARQPDTVRLILPDGRIGPWRYEAAAKYCLEAQRLRVSLSVTSRADCPLPYGGGFHPWFPRGPATTLQFRATGHWPEDDRHLPSVRSPLPVPEKWRWNEPAPLPADWINAGFSGWDGATRIQQGDDACSIRLTARDFTTAILYAPGDAMNFFCFEPVSHPVDAHNLPGRPGLVTLNAGDSWACHLILAWGPQRDDPSPSTT